MKEDDANLLTATIQKYAEEYSMSVEHLCACMKDWMWKRDNTIVPKKTKGLIAAAACNQKGVPEHGAEKCLCALLSMFPPGSGSPVCSRGEIKRAWYGAQKAGRENCMEMLRSHWEYYEALCEADAGNTDMMYSI